MDLELDKKLVQDFPILYRDRYSDETETAMCWGFDVGDGWEPIIRDLSEKIESYNKDNTDRPVIVFQVKEKFGGLRFYVSTAPRFIYDAIDNAENKSYHTCEKCGKPGKLRNLHWILTLCDDCYNEYQPRGNIFLD